MSDLRKASKKLLQILDDKPELHGLVFWIDNLKSAREELRQTLAQPEPTVEDNSQQWKGMDGAVAWHLIDRHADNWADIGKMMDEWLKANQAQPEQEPVAFPDAPTTIYLQVCDDMGCEEPFCEHHDVSWCEDKINNSDVKYIRADTAPPNREWVELTEKRIHEIWHEQWDAHAGNWAEEFVYHLGKAYEQELKGNNT